MITMAVQEDSSWWAPWQSGKKSDGHRVSPGRQLLAGAMAVWEDGQRDCLGRQLLLGGVAIWEDCHRWWVPWQSGKTATSWCHDSPGRWPLVGVAVLEDSCW